MMLQHSQPQDLNAALRGDTITGNLRVINMLLDRGAQAPPTIAVGSALSDADSSRHDPEFSQPRGQSESDGPSKFGEHLRNLWAPHDQPKVDVAERFRELNQSRS